MKKLWIVVGLLLSIFTVAPLRARSRFQGYAERGGQTVITALTGTSAKAQRSFPLSTINVYIDGTTTPATIYSDNAGTVIPGGVLTSDSAGHFQFWGDSAVYALKFSPAGYASWTISGWGSAGNPAAGSKFDVRNCTATDLQLSALGNGLTKPLSGFYASLATAQTDYPEASALSDELDWAALQKCTTAAANATILAGSALNQSGGAVDIPNGVYVINRQISVNPGTLNQRGSFTDFIGRGHPTINQTAVGADILVWQLGANSGANYDNLVSGINFRGGRRQIAFANGNNEGGRMSVVDCGFIASDDYAVYGAQNGSTALNTLLTIERARFTGCKKILYTTSAPTKLSNVWVTGGDISTGLNNTPANTALIYADTGSKLLMDNFYGSPVLDETLSQRWVDVHGQALYIDRSRFGGELAGGVPVVYWYTAPNASNGFNTPSPTVFSITNSDISSGTSNLSGTNVGVLNLRTNVPQLMIFRGNRYFFEFAKINNGGAINFATYFAGQPTHYVFKLESEPDWKWFGDDPIGAGQPPDIPPTLRQYLTFGDVEGGGQTPRAIPLVNGLNSNVSIQQTYKNLLLSGPTGAFSVGGFDNPWAGREVRVMYLGAQAMTIVNADASSTAANRIRTNTGANIVGAHVFTLIYDQASTTWVLVSYN